MSVVLEAEADVAMTVTEESSGNNCTGFVGGRGRDGVVLVGGRRLVSATVWD